MADTTQSSIDFGEKSAILQKSVRYFFNLFVQIQAGGVLPRSASWWQVPANTFFLTFLKTPTLPQNPTKVPYRFVRETIDGVFGSYQWE